MEQARALVAQYKSLRAIVQFGRQYRISSPRTEAVAAVLYIARDRSEGVVFGFLNRNHFSDPLLPLRLPGFDAERAYEVDAGNGKTRVLSGAALARVGILLDLQNEYDSQIVRIRSRS